MSILKPFLDFQPPPSGIWSQQDFQLEAAKYLQLAARKIAFDTIIVGISTALLIAFFSMREPKRYERFPLPLTIPNEIGQIVLVTSPSWNSPTGQLERLERHSEQWVRVGQVIPVNFGDKGLAWGTGLHQPILEYPQKKEGDHRAPAGIFGMGPVFGYGSSPPMGTTLPYQRITDRDYFIDDFESVDYNKLIRIGDAEPNEPAHRWRSFEVMHRTDNLYQLGVVIQQNITPIVKGKGSAIFFHVWRGPNSPTLGCTSMSLGDLRSLVTWLDPRMSPVLIQAPTSSIEILRFGTPP